MKKRFHETSFKEKAEYILLCTILPAAWVIDKLLRACKRLHMNRKKTLAGVLAVAMLCTMLPLAILSVSAATEFPGGGEGTEAAPYKISTAEELKLFAAIVNGTDVPEGFSANNAACAVLTDDIDLNLGYTFTFEPDTGLVKVEKAGDGIKGYFGTGIPGDMSGGNNIFDYFASSKGFFYDSDDSAFPSANALVLPQWTPIGTNENRYTGTFDGNGKTVSGLVLYINPQNDYVGLFGSVGSGGTVKNVTVASSYICGKLYIGGICGDNVGGTIINCSSSAIIPGNIYVGGICGNLSGGDITNCYSIGKFFGIQSVGSVLGNNAEGTVTNCYYLTDSALDSRKTPQFGIGYAVGGSNTADISGNTAGKTAGEFANGSVTVALNNGTNPIVWYQKSGVPALIPYTPAKLNDGYYEIKTAEDLFWFAAQVNGGNTGYNAKLMEDIKLNPGYTFTFDADTGLVEIKKNETAVGYFGTGIKGSKNGNTVFDTTASEKGAFYFSKESAETATLTEALREWSPIGTRDKKYGGIFDGNGKTVSGIYYNDTTASRISLFGYLFDGTIKNLTVADSCIIANSYVGGVCGTITDKAGTISRCSNAGTVIGGTGAGGVCGTTYGTISWCSNVGTVIGNDNIGGVTGYDSGVITGCYNTGTVIGNTQVGGVSGGAGGGSHEIYCCYNTGTVVGNSYVGGVIGNAMGSSQLGYAYNTGTVVGNSYVGGVSGFGIFSNSYYLGITDASYGTGIGKSAAEFADGTVAYLLNDNRSVGTEASPLVWYQNIDNGETPDTSPKFTGGTVYYVPELSKYSNDQNGVPAPVISLTITWGAMEFTYIDASEGTWNSDTLSYENQTPAVWTCDADANKITVTSESNAELTTSFSYEQAEGVTVNGSFTDGTNPITDALPLAKGNETPQTVAAYLKLDGKPEETANSSVAGTITVTIGG